MFQDSFIHLYYNSAINANLFYTKILCNNLNMQDSNRMYCMYRLFHLDVTAVRNKDHIQDEYW